MPHRLAEGGAEEEVGAKDEEAGAVGQQGQERAAVKSFRTPALEKDNLMMIVKHRILRKSPTGVAAMEVAVDPSRREVAVVRQYAAKVKAEVGDRRLHPRHWFNLLMPSSASNRK